MSPEPQLDILTKREGCMAYKLIVYAWEHAKLAYEEPKTLPDSDFALLKTDNDFCYIAAYKYKIVISFKGTTGDLGAWLSNFDPYPLDGESYIKKYLGSGMIHDGFYDSWSKFKDWVTAIMSEYIDKPNINEIIVTGHSRGGALAELCSRHLAKNMKLPCSCFTFGCPAPGNKRYRNEFRLLPINGTRVVNGWDIVTFTPPYILGFRHGCANKVWNQKSWWKRFLPYSRTKDHLVKSYDQFINKRYG